MQLTFHGVAAIRNKKVALCWCHDDLLMEAGDVNKHNMPTYDELLHMLDLKSICISTVWRWMVYLGYQYDENNRS